MPQHAKAGLFPDKTPSLTLNLPGGGDIYPGTGGWPNFDYGHETLCLGRGKPKRVCRECRHFAPGRPTDCREPMTEPVLDKERANFCEPFGLAPSHSNTTDPPQRVQDLFK